MTLSFIKKKDNKKLFTGYLIDGNDDQVIIKEKNTEREITFERKEIAKISRTVCFN